jgi:hypothetical protein
MEPGKPRHKAIGIAGIALSALACVYFGHETIHTDNIIDPQTHHTVKAVDINPVAGFGLLASVTGIGLFASELRGKLKL